ncbi:hypothetical protein ACTVBU_10755 [Sanguibacter sp. A246]|uniref:hypothetical protein n=1 Tax=Sanguibacter sp. A246 TaxID=3457326 RepID=UPI003FD716B2
MTTYCVSFSLTVGEPSVAAFAVVAIVAVVAIASRRDARRTAIVDVHVADDAAPALCSHREQARPRQFARTRRWVGRVAEEVLISGLGGLLTNLLTLVLQLGSALFAGG